MGLQLSVLFLCEKVVGIEASAPELIQYPLLPPWRGSVGPLVLIGPCEKAP